MLYDAWGMGMIRVSLLAVFIKEGELHFPWRERETIVCVLPGRCASSVLVSVHMRSKQSIPSRSPHPCFCGVTAFYYVTAIVVSYFGKIASGISPIYSCFRAEGTVLGHKM